MTQKLVLRLGNCVEVMRTLEEGSVGGVVTDPPY
jgi:DNA modification methylase